MSLMTLHDKVRSLGLGALYERHLACNFRDLFDDRSAEWSATPMGQKVVDLKAMEIAGVPVGEVVAHYRETISGEPDGDAALARLPAALRAYREAAFAPPLPPDLEPIVCGAS